MALNTSFSVGRRWLCDEDSNGVKRMYPFHFVIIGPPKYSSPKTHKRCRLEVIGHSEKCSPHCEHSGHGIEQDYSHKHLKKYAKLLEE